MRLPNLYEADVVDIWTPLNRSEYDGSLRTSSFLRTLPERLCDHYPLQAQDKVNALLDLQTEHQMFHFHLSMFNELPVDSVIVVLSDMTYWRVSRPSRKWTYPEGHWDITATWVHHPAREIEDYYAG